MPVREVIHAQVPAVCCVERDGHVLMMFPDGMTLDERKRAARQYLSAAEMRSLYG